MKKRVKTNLRQDRDLGTRHRCMFFIIVSFVVGCCNNTFCWFHHMVVSLNPSWGCFCCCYYFRAFSWGRMQTTTHSSMQGLQKTLKVLHTFKNHAIKLYLMLFSKVAVSLLGFSYNMENHQWVYIWFLYTLTCLQIEVQDILSIFVQFSSQDILINSKTFIGKVSFEKN